MQTNVRLHQNALMFPLKREDIFHYRFFKKVPVRPKEISIPESQGGEADSTPDFITFLRHHIAHNDNQRVT